MTGAEVRIDTVAIDRLLSKLGEVRESAAIAVKLSLQAMAGDVVRNKMSGQYLGVVTGTARRSITVTEVQRGGNVLSGSFGSPLKYVRAHEEGFTGFVEIPQHTRRIRLTRVTAKGQRVKISEKRRLGFALQGKKTLTTVAAHRRLMVIREKRFIRASLWEGLSGAERRVARAIEILLMKGRPPVPAELGA